MLVPCIVMLAVPRMIAGLYFDLTAPGNQGTAAIAVQLLRSPHWWRPPLPAEARAWAVLEISCSLLSCRLDRRTDLPSTPFSRTVDRQ